MGSLSDTLVVAETAHVAGTYVYLEMARMANMLPPTNIGIVLCLLPLYSTADFAVRGLSKKELGITERVYYGLRNLLK